jgi:putative polyhydroxyalkanoate system protein
MRAHIFANTLFSMPDIDIFHPHTKTPAQAREAVEDVARKLAERFDFKYRWDGDALNFSRSGVDGSIALLPSQLHVNAKLGFMLSMLQGPIEAEIRRVLAEKFG